MAKYEIEVSATAEKQLRRLNQADQIRILTRVTGLSDEPRPVGSRKLRGYEDIYRIRIGDYRVLYSVEDDRLIIIVLKVGHRRGVYR
ncbi:MAG: type II toxin-antitoxin system RelE/ParE family toxin [Pseudomonadales bacterium]|jgi:mRNA interferase RelE/StbE|nr:type II toxin-antitoxin system RelE/ParE family toxin [Pseudomonadales bacterium]MDP7360059.1 type II toxin-antitoxin system RelE/ParE family toxin [Pseudomonadales bacterium]MDP7598133.1 type II toxin-antitoxin system RelE/ParE family toxin [Pseudomonadales bacterium]HJN49370.1 type II toxin-antitoxin system RelE/ParE family toxin [Pseudomonadales bacterium]